MKKILLVVLIVIISMLSVSCLEIAKNEPQPTPAETENTAPPDATGVALAYMDPDIDIFIVVPDAAWTYTKELYEGEAYFYPGDEDPTMSPNGFAISSQPKGDGGIAAYWESWEPSLERQINGFDWNKEDDITIGNYTGSRYHFTASTMDGDFIFWETDDLLYICSLTSDKDSYDSNYALLVGALASFKTLDEVGEK